MEEFKPGMTIWIDGERYTFLPGKWLRYERGRYGKVYSMEKEDSRNGNTPYALKVFFEPDETIIKRTYGVKDEKEDLKGIYYYGTVRGLTTANRKVINRYQHKVLTARFQSLDNSVLMPRIRGKSWVNILNKNQRITPEQSLSLARAVSSVLLKLEQRRLAHCDICAANFVFSPDFRSIELVDIEDLYSPDIDKMFQKGYLRARPKPKGTDGYAPKWVVADGYWGPDADRFAVGILITEILCWQFPDFQQRRSGETLFLSEFFGKKSTGFNQVRQRLAEIRTDGNVDTAKLVDLLIRVWFSKSPDECPFISEWHTALQPEGTKEPSSVMLKVSTFQLDFGTEQTATLIISKEGSDRLIGKLKPEPWLEADRPLDFDISDDGASVLFTLKLKRIPPPPPPISGDEQRIPKAIVIESTGGYKVVGAKYKVRR